MAKVLSLPILIDPIGSMITPSLIIIYAGQSAENEPPDLGLQLLQALTGRLVLLLAQGFALDFQLHQASLNLVDQPIVGLAADPSVA